MTRFSLENAAAHGRRGGQCAYQRQPHRYAALVLSNSAEAQRLAYLVQKRYRLGLALRVVTLSDQMQKGGR